MKITTFDLETRIPAMDLEQGWLSVRSGEAGIAAAATSTRVWGFWPRGNPERPYEMAGGGLTPKHVTDAEIRLWDDHCAGELADYLEEADLVVTFNGKHFDLPIVSAIAGRDLHLKRHYDIREEIVKQVGQFTRGYNLAALGERVLGRSKSRSSAHLGQLVVEGRFAELFQHALEDVELTEALLWVIIRNRALDGFGVRNPLEELDAQEEEAE